VKKKAGVTTFVQTWPDRTLQGKKFISAVIPSKETVNIFRYKVWGSSSHYSRCYSCSTEQCPWR